MLLYFAVKLTRLVVCAIDRLEWYQLDRIGGEIGSVALVFCFGSAVFNFVRGTFEFRDDLPRAGERICELGDHATARIGADGPTSKHNISDGKQLWIRTVGINKFAMPGTLLLDQKTSYVSKGGET